MKIFAGIFGILLIVGITATIWGISVSNSEKELVNRSEAQTEVCEAYFDKMWKILKTKAGVSSEYKESFKDIYLPLIEGRYDNDKGSLMSWIQEDNPEFSVDLYKDLMEAISSERTGFFVEQKKLRSIKKEHDDLRDLFPSTLIVGNRDELTVMIIKSLNTKQVYELGEENDVALFGRE